ncbi:MAG: single-stranded DNA-binding protein [Bacillota bacterium]|nr:single-stranded DNA-binding protein [Bacillota bacterium]
MLNRIVIIGRLTRDPELRSTANGTPVCTFTLAVDRAFKSANGERETDFIPVVVWRQLAETCGRYLAKGKMAAVDGRLQIRTYQAQDGSKRTAAEVVAENVRFLSPKDNSSSSYGSSGYVPDVPEVEMMPPDDIPF